VLDWRHEGLIDPELSELLLSRFETGPRLLSTALRWLGVFALLLFGSSILGLIGTVIGTASLMVAPLLLAAIVVVAWRFGVRMATDPEQRYPTTGAILLTAGLICVFGALSLAFFAYGGADFEPVYPAFMLITAAAAIATAYRYGLRWPLTLGLLLVFHALGNWHGYAGHGAYWLGIRDERVTAAASLLALGLGLWHEYRWEGETQGRWLGFGHLYVIFGLLYLNVCAWFLSLFPGGLSWVLVFSALGIAQLVAGARLRDPRLVGFGIVFLSIDLYTRFFERFWNSLSKAEFFLLAGLIAVVAGALMELKSRGERLDSDA
jgi:hypothetical protein